jgi:hypothetical protein
MRKIFTAIVAAGMSVSPLAWADTLVPGKPAGVHQAQMGDKEWLVLGGVGLTAAVVIAVTASSSSAAAPTTQPISVVTTSP